MPKSRRDQKRARREAKRKEKHRTMRAQSKPKSKRSLLHAALKWPVMECWLSANWEDPLDLDQAVVTRRDPATGEVYMSMFLVDRACLGLKDAHVANFVNAAEFRNTILAHMQETQELIQVDIDFVAAVVKAGIDYAAQFDLRPHRDYRDASILLKDANPDAVDVNIPVGGDDGKPFFIAGPYDNAQKIVARLTQQLGPDGFHYTVRLDPDDEMLDDLGLGAPINVYDAEALDEDAEVLEGEYTFVEPDEE